MTSYKFLLFSTSSFSVAMSLNSPSISLPDWVDQLFKQIYFQADDAVAVKAFADYISPDFTAR